MVKDSKGSKTSKSKGSLGLRKTLGEAEVGGGSLSVSAGLSFDVLPLDVDISLKDENLGIKGELGLPGDVLAVGGGVVVDINTGEVVGGSASASAGGATVEVSLIECERSISISYWGISVAYSDDVCGGGGGDGGGDDDATVPPPPPGIPPQPNFGIPPGYTGLICPVFERRNSSLFVASGGILELTYKEQYIEVGWIVGSFLDWDNSLSGWVREEGNHQLTNPPYESRFSHEVTEGPRSLKIIDKFYSSYTGQFSSYGGGFYFDRRDLYLLGFDPGDCREVIDYYPPAATSNHRRPIPPTKDMNDCCNASISLLRKISQVLAVDALLVEDENLKISTDTVATFKQQYDQIAEQLSEGQKPKVLFDNYLEFKIYQMAVGGNAKVDDIAKVLGVEDGRSRFPFKMPESLRNVDGNEPVEKDIDDYPEAFGYLIDRIDELIGQFDIEIEIEDTDPTTQGNQSQKIKIGNISEGIAEIIGLIFAVGQNSKVGTEAAVKSLISIGMLQRIVTEIDAVTEEIFDHLEIPMKEVEREIDLEFSPGVKNFDAFFKPSKERVKVPERLQGKNAPTLQDQLDILLQAATIIKSRGFRKVNPYQDIGAQVVGNLASGLLDKYVLNNSDDPNKPPDPNKKSDFDDFIDDVQENFRDYEKPGEIDLEKSDNPKIIILNKPVPTPAPKPTEGG